jgi:hypothetical protein
VRYGTHFYVVAQRKQLVDRQAGVSWRTCSVTRSIRRSVSSIVSRYSCAVKGIHAHGASSSLVRTALDTLLASSVPREFER